MTLPTCLSSGIELMAVDVADAQVSASITDQHEQELQAAAAVERLRDAGVEADGTLHRHAR